MFVFISKIKDRKETLKGWSEPLLKDITDRQEGRWALPVLADHLVDDGGHELLDQALVYLVL